MTDSNNSDNFSANTRCGLIKNDDIKHHEQIEECEMATTCKEVTKTEVHVDPQDSMSSNEDIPPDMNYNSVVLKLRKVEEDNKRLIEEVKKLRNLVASDDTRIKKANLCILLDGVYDKIFERCNTLDEEQNAHDWCPYGCNICWETYEDIVQEELDKAKN